MYKRQTYGYASSGESFSIVDRDEAWIMELIGKGYKADGKGGNANKGIVWVARRIPDGYVSAHANQARITTFPKNDPENGLYAPDVVSFAREMGSVAYTHLAADRFPPSSESPKMQFEPGRFTGWMKWLPGKRSVRTISPVCMSNSLIATSPVSSLRTP